MSFIHHYIPGKDVTLVLLHGTGGDENDLLPLGRMLLPGAALLSPRGKTLENGMPRFFRRRAEGVFDLEDLRLRANELADFVSGFAGNKIAVGYSNGANIAAAIFLLRPEVFTGGILLRAMVPLEPEVAPDLTSKNVFLSGGRQDPIVAPENTARLAKLLETYGAQVTLNWEDTGHGLTDHELALAKKWLTTIST